jgi:hypothetical protein
MDIRRILAASVVVAAASLSFARYADAGSITVSDLVNSITIDDNGAGDTNLADGIIRFNGSIGVWDIVVTVGKTKPALGSVTDPAMDVTLSADSTAAGTLLVTFKEEGFSSPSGGILTATFAGQLATGGYATYETFEAPTFQSFSGTFGPATATASVAPSSSYYLIQRVGIHHDAAGGLSQVHASLAVPDGGWTVAMLGSALLAIGLLRRRLGVR